MICIVCSEGEIFDGVTTVKFEHGDFRLELSDVPARICPSCGEAYVDQAIAAQLLMLARQSTEAGMLNAQGKYSAL